MLGFVVVLNLLEAVFVHAPDYLPQVDAFLAAVKPWAIALQLSIVGLLWVRWPHFVRWLADRGHIREAGVKPLLRARHRLMTMALVLVLIVTAGLPFSLLAPPHGG